MTEAPGKNGIPALKLNLAGLPSGGGWALGEQVQLVPSMNEQVARGMRVFTV